MQYAVISTGGKQYIATPGQELVIERLQAEEGSTVTFDQVLLTVDGKNVVVGQPLVDGVVVTATLVANNKADKIRVFKYKSKSRYRRTQGHRQHQTVVRIESIGAPKAAKKTSKKAEAEAVKE